MELTPDMMPLVIGAGLAVMMALIGVVLLQTRTQQSNQLFDLSKREGRHESRTNPIQSESNPEQQPSGASEPAINWQISFSGDQNMDDAISKVWGNLAARKADGSMDEWRSRLKQGIPAESMLPQLMAMMEQSSVNSGSIIVEVFDPGVNPERLVSLIMKATGKETAEARAMAEQSPVTFEVDGTRMDYASLQQALQDAGIQSFQLRSQMQSAVNVEQMEQLAEHLGNMPIPGLGQSLFSGGPGIFLVDVGNNKIGVIKEIREATGLGLKEAKDIADHAPVRLQISDSHSRDRLISALRALGAKVETQ